jgi:hypothetical protein
MDDTNKDIGPAVRMSGNTYPQASAAAIRNLSVLSYAQGFTHWMYKLPTGSAYVRPDFLSEVAYDMLEAGDMVTISSPSHGQVVNYAVASGKHIYVMGS